MRKADKNKLGYVITNTRDSDSWYTPNKYIESVRFVLGSIDLDPFSSNEANHNVKASVFYTKENDSLSFTWGSFDNCYTNPPYSKGLMQKCVEKVTLEVMYNNIKNVILLCNASTDTKWFHLMLENSDLMCITLGRISFENTDGKSISGNTKGQCFFLISSDSNIKEKFKQEFSKYGFIVNLKG